MRVEVVLTTPARRRGCRPNHVVAMRALCRCPLPLRNVWWATIL